MEFKTEERRLAQLLDDIESIVEKAESEGRNLTNVESTEVREAFKEIDKLTAKVDETKFEGKLRALKKWANEPRNEAIKPELGNRGAYGYASIERNFEDRTYRGLFGTADDNYGWHSFAEFVGKIGRGIPDGRLERSLQGGVPADGGFLVPETYAAEVFDRALANEVIRPRARNYAMTSDTLKIPAVVNSDNSSGLYGVTITWVPEGGSLVESNPTFRQITLTAHKATSYFIASNEFIADGINANDTLMSIMSNALSFELDKQFLRGDGSAKPQGIENSPALVTVSKETGQAADTVVYENITNMWSRLHTGSHRNAIWVIHPTVLPELLEMSLAVGTGGAPVFIAGGSVGGAPHGTLFGRPIVISQHMATLGSRFDVALIDPSQYAVAIRQGISLASSMHVAFSTDQLALRGICRIDGQGLWESSLTLSDGVTTVSPFVCLEARE